MHLYRLLLSLFLDMKGRKLENALQTLNQPFHWQGEPHYHKAIQQTHMIRKFLHLHRQTTFRPKLLQVQSKNLVLGLVLSQMEGNSTFHFTQWHFGSVQLQWEMVHI